MSEVCWDDGHSAVFVNAWLRDHCRCPECLNKATHQRGFDSRTIPSPADVAVQPWETGAGSGGIGDGPLRLESVISSHGAADGAAGPAADAAQVHTIEMPSDWLRRHCHADARPPELPVGPSAPAPVTLWDPASLRGVVGRPRAGVPDRLAGVPALSAAELASDPSGGGQHLRSCLREFGIVFVSGVLPSPDGGDGGGDSQQVDAHARVEALVRSHVGFPRETLWGYLWDTAGDYDPDKPPDTAYTTLELRPHADCCYLRDPPQLQVFLCAQRAVEGGASTFLDAFNAAQALWRRSPEAFRFFCETHIPFHCVHDGVAAVAAGPPLKLASPLSESQWDTLLAAPPADMPPLAAVRYNNDDRAPLTDLSARDVARFYTHLPHLLDVLRDPETTLRVDMQVGDLVVVVNPRVFHGREAFEGFGLRNLVGCYAEMDEVDATNFSG